EYRLAKARVAGSNPVSRLPLSLTTKDIIFVARLSVFIGLSLHVFIHSVFMVKTFKLYRCEPAF
ncbi:MAG: hypothetical protein ACLRZ7_08575, partial [Lachnospiraceae bacterium]